MITTSPCSFCSRPISLHSQKEHIFPNAIGGRKTVRHFICRQCNNDTGSKWDAKLVEQLRPICTQLEIKRQKGKNQPYPVRGSDGVDYMYREDGFLSLRHPSCYIDDDSKMFKIQARSLREANRMLQGLARKYPKGNDLKKDASELMENASDNGDAIAYESVVLFGEGAAGRSVIKTCLAMAHSLGVDASHCDLALDYLLHDGEPCFGYFNTPEVVVDRPSDVPFHCVWISGNDTSGLLVAYVEYFGYERMIACLSNTYKGQSISGGYSVDPMSGEELNVIVNLDITRADIQRSYDYKAVDDQVRMAAIESLMRLIQKQRWNRERDAEIMRAHEKALSSMGLPSDHALSELPDEDFKVYSSVMAEHLTKWAMQYYVHPQRS